MIGYLVEMPDGHKTWFEKEPTYFREQKWIDLGVKVHTMVSIDPIAETLVAAGHTVEEAIALAADARKTVDADLLVRPRGPIANTVLDRIANLRHRINMAGIEITQDSLPKGLKARLETTHAVVFALDSRDDYRLDFVERTVSDIEADVKAWHSLTAAQQRGQRSSEAQYELQQKHMQGLLPDFFKGIK